MMRVPESGADTAPGKGPRGQATSPVERFSIVIPTIARQSLFDLMQSLVEQERWGDSCPAEVIVVDDRPVTGEHRPNDLEWTDLPWPVTVLRSGGRGPAAARNAGWRTTRTPWVVFLDDDVLVPPDWSSRLQGDLHSASSQVGGIQARIQVPSPAGRRPTDWERNTAGLAVAKWITADMAYRRPALMEVAGFDEGFPRAFREDADLAVRVRRAGWELARGERVTVHPVRRTGDWVSVRVQAGNADDALLRARYGRRWRAITEAGPGRTGRHLATVAAAAATALAIFTGRWRSAGWLAGSWAVLTGEFLWARVAPGPRPATTEFPGEFRRMAMTSVLIPFAAVAGRVRGLRRHGWRARSWPPRIRAVLFDRDGTLVHDEPYNGDPDKVRPVVRARPVLDGLRSAGIKVGVISNQSGIGRGLLSADEVARVNERVAELLGPIDAWQVCPHAPTDRCWCRKPEGLMVLRAAAALGVQPAECAVIGDIGTDLEAAIAAGAVGVLVPTAVTRVEEIDDAELVAGTLSEAVELVRRGHPGFRSGKFADPWTAPAGSPRVGGTAA